MRYLLKIAPKMDIKIEWSSLIELTKETLAELPEQPGIYRLSYKSDEDKYYVFYVGTTTNLKTSIINHTEEKEDNVCIKARLSRGRCAVKYSVVENESVRASGLWQAYKFYQPSCNQTAVQHPGGDIVINLN